MSNVRLRLGRVSGRVEFTADNEVIYPARTSLGALLKANANGERVACCDQLRKAGLIDVSTRVVFIANYR